MEIQRFPERRNKEPFLDAGEWLKLKMNNKFGKRAANSTPRKINRINEWIASKYGLSILILLIDALCIFLTICLLSMYEALLQGNIGFIPINQIRFERYKIVWMLVLMLVIIYDITLVIKIRIAYSTKGYNIGQKGSMRWTTLKEIQAQYKEVSEKDIPYTGTPGTIVSRYKDKIYLDQSPTNNLYIGITRSGKDEMFVYPSIDVCSRADIQPSMIITDIKLDAYPACYETLTKRGYIVHLINYQSPADGSGYNPLNQIVKEYKKGNESEAQLLCNSFCYTIYGSENNNSSGDHQYFVNNSVFCVSAAIMAMISDNIKADRIANSKRKKQWEKKQELYRCLTREEQQEARVYFDVCLAEFIEEEQYKILDKVKCIPEDKVFIETTENEKKINMYSLVTNFSSMAEKKLAVNYTLLDYYFDQRPETDIAKYLFSSVRVAGDRSKGNIMSNALSKLLFFTYTDIAKMTAQNSFNLEDVGFGDKPMAIFLGVPDYDHSKDFLVSTFISQLMMTISKKAAFSQDKKCKRHVKFILNEFGNFPQMSGIVSNVTTCLGRNISLDMYIQAYEQLEEKYGKHGAKTIASNCGNQIYILTNSINTAKEFSELIGAETITTVSRQGTKMSLKKNFTESFESRELLNANQLMELEEGFCVVKRVMKRRDNKGRSIKPTPIFNCDRFGTRFKYRYQYMLDRFPANKNFLDVPHEVLKDIDLKEIKWDAMKNLQMPKREKNTKKLKELSQYEVIDLILQNVLKEEYEKNIDPDMGIEEVMWIVNFMVTNKHDKDNLMKLMEKG